MARLATPYRRRHVRGATSAPDAAGIGSAGRRAETRFQHEVIAVLRATSIALDIRRTRVADGDFVHSTYALDALDARNAMDAEADVM